MKRILVAVTVFVFFAGTALAATIGSAKLGQYKSANFKDCNYFVGDKAFCEETFADDHDADLVLNEDDQCKNTPIVIAELVWADLGNRLQPETRIAQGIPSDITIGKIDLRYVLFDGDTEKAHLMIASDDVHGFPKWTQVVVPGDYSVGIPGSPGDMVRWIAREGEHIVLLFTKTVGADGCEGRR